MSGSTVVTERTRRKAVRSAGPPAEEHGAGQNSEPGAAPQKPADAEQTEATSAEPVVSKQAVDDAAIPERVDISKSGGPGSAATPEPQADEVTAEAESADITRADVVKAGAQRGRVWRIVSYAAVAVLVLALFIGGGLATYGIHTADSRATLREDYLQFGRQAAVNMTTIRSDSVQQDVDRVYAMSSGTFKSEFDRLMKDFIDYVREAKVVSDGKAAEAAVESADDNSARILIASTMTVTNSGLDKPQQRVFRMRLTITRDDSGMSLSGLEFVS